MRRVLANRLPFAFPRAGLALVLLLLAGTGCGRAGPDAAGGRAGADSGGPQVLLLGLDGADWEIIDRLEAEGRLPHLSRLRREGAWGVLRSEEPLLSPVVWTTIATGRTPGDHGIVGFLTRRGGVTEPVRSDERRVRAFWNVASDLGVTVGVIGWYASWPAERVNGFLVSDRVGSHQIEGSAARVRTGLAWPESLESEIEALRDEVEREIGPRDAARFFTAGDSAGGARVRIEQQRLDTFVGILRTTELYRRLFPRLRERYDPALMAVYFEGTDAVGHLFAEFVPPPLPGIDPEQSVHLAPAFDRFYEVMDGIVGEIVAGLDPARATLIAVSDHGFKTGPRRPRTPSVTAYANQAPIWHRPEGVLLLWGRGVRPGTALPESSIYDVVPTAMRLLDLPLAATLKGRPVEEALAPELLARAARTVPDYEAAGARETGEAGALPADAELEKLRALGYIGGETVGDEAAGAPAAREGQAGVPLNRYNQGVILMNAGKKREALEVFRALQRDEPGFALGYLGEGLLLLQEGRGAEAIPILERAIRADPRVGALHAALGEAHLQAGRAREARRSLERAVEMDPGDGRTALLLAQVLFSGREFGQAARLFEAARGLAESPADRAAACVGLAVLAEERRDLDAAQRFYEEALGLVPAHPGALERFGNLELYRKRPERAAELLSSLARARPDSPKAHALHGRALAAAGRTAEARAALQRSLSLDPSQQEVRALLGRLPAGPS